MIAIIDYGVGNLFSLESSFGYIGKEAELTSDVEKIKAADRLILPGVGAFADAAKKLRESGLAEVVIDEARSGKPLLGICLGMQMLFERSYEYGEHDGLGLISGSVKPMRDIIPADMKIPQIGWNKLKLTNPSPLFKNISDGDHVYFVHSYYATDCADVIATAEYGASVTAALAFICSTMWRAAHCATSLEVSLIITLIVYYFILLITNILEVV